MSAFSDTYEDLIVQHILGVSAMAQPAAIYVSGHTAAPDESGTPDNEISAAWYGRQQPATGWNAADTVTPSNGATNNGLIQWNAVTGSAVTMTHIGLWTAMTGGDLILYIALPTPKIFGVGSQPEIADGNLRITIGGALSNYAIPKLIDHILGGTAWTMPTTQHLALYAADPTAADVATEVSGGGYARLPIGFDVPSAGVSLNSSLEDFGTATADIATISHFGIRDAITAGNLLVFGAWDSALTVDNGDDYKVLQNALGIGVL